MSQHIEPLASKIRPKNIDEYVGQEHLVGIGKPLRLAIENKLIFSFILWGTPGTGKTTIARIYADAIKADFFELSAVSAGKDDIRTIIKKTEETEKPVVLFLDEIHRFNKAQQDFLLPYVESGKITLIGATTKAGMLSAPLRDRFGLVHRLRFYEDDDLQDIVLNAASKLDIIIDSESALEIAKRSRGTARIALKLLKRVLDFAQVEHQKSPNPEITKKSLEFYQVDESGLDETDRKLLEAIIKDHDGGPVGLETLAALVSEDLNTITDIYEPFLMQSGFLARTPRGRIATPKAYSHLGLNPKK